jgi:predicted transcriptional regulator
MPARRGFNRDEILAMYKNGMTQKDIAEELGTSSTTICYYINQAGLGTGKGNFSKHKNRGGVVASSIPKVEYVVTEEEKLEEEKRVQAEKNAANACLVVMDNVITLEGVIGRYEVSRKDKKVLATINGDEFDFTFEQVMGLCDEFRALARNLDSVEAVGAEMW